MLSLFFGGLASPYFREFFFLPKEDMASTTFFRTCVNGINALTGIGILSISFALAQGGWLSFALLFLVAAMSCYTGLLLNRCMDSDPSIQSYPDIGERAFGLKGRILISIFLYLELYLIAIEYLILEGDNLDKLFPNKSIKVGALKVVGKKAFLILAALVILPTTWVRNLGIFAYISSTGILASLLPIFCVWWAGIDGVGFHGKVALLKWQGLPTTLSLFTFCYGGHPVFPTLKTSLANKSQFFRVLLVCFVMSTFSYGSMAVAGYMMYGEDLQSQVTLNLPKGKISTSIAIYTTLVNPITKYGIIVTPIATAIEGRVPLGNNILLSVLIRTLIVISTAILALLIPFFGYVMSFIGAFLSVTMSMILPCLCYIKMKGAGSSLFQSMLMMGKAKAFRLELILIMGMLLISSMVGILGTYTSVKHIISHL